MKKILSTMAVLAVIGSALPAHAADKKLMLPFAGALEDNGAKERLGDTIKYYFGTQKTPKVLEKRGSDQTSQKTNAFGKTDQAVCHWAFLSSMLALQKRAQEVGANAVINITSNYKNATYSSETDFECHVGNIVGGVALKGDFVRLADGKK
ncbi:excinuclease ATPase subunit [Massilia sp. DJPM01]|uniref:excinuclease ATPase subunit n=1 Tax=Massilia sp. DJPM01 TaxID=3024404 RepID=UPI00259FBAF7|nr:excinuclease ATPase subunit [Massilia sp. DJPM01]MDM5181594.1 excinuclease ATPase subunit [Massilia sp. DJPM01]